MKLVQSYLHGKALGIPATIGVLIELEAEVSDKENRGLLDELGRDLTMHIAATSPSHIGNKLIQERARVDEEEENGEPGDLLIQSWIKDPDKLVGEVIYEYESKIGAPITINRFVRYAINDT